MPFTDLDLVLRSLCGNVLDRAAVRTLAVVRHLAATLELPVDVVCSLVAPMDTLGHRRRRRARGPVRPDVQRPGRRGRGERSSGARGSSRRPTAATGALTCTGDLLAPRNTEFRRRVVRALGLSETDLAEIVRRFRRQYRTLRETGPFDGDETGLAALSLLHRVARLTGALDLAPAELFAVLDALNGDPSIRGHNTFDLLIDTPAREPRLLPDPRRAAPSRTGSGWCRPSSPWSGGCRRRDLTGAELIEILGGAARQPARTTTAGPPPLAVLDELYQQFQAVLLAPEVFVSERFGPRSARVVHDGLLAGGGPSPRGTRGWCASTDPGRRRRPPPTPACCGSR